MVGTDGEEEEEGPWSWGTEGEEEEGAIYEWGEQTAPGVRIKGREGGL